MTTDLDRLDQIRQFAQGIQQTVADILAGQQPPQPPPMTRVTTALELQKAVDHGGDVLVAPGAYTANVKARVPVRLFEETPGTVQIAPLDPFDYVLDVQTSLFRMQGFRLLNGAIDRGAVRIGDERATDPNTQPDDVAFEDTVLQAGPSGGKRGFEAHTRRFRASRIQVLNFFSASEGQAFWACNGPGPYLLEDSTLEATGENIMFGGERQPCGVNCSGIIRRNLIRKPLGWKGLGYKVKNAIELKSCVGGLIEGNTIDGMWGGEGQDGSVIVLTPRNQYGDAPHTQVDDVVISGNRLQNCATGAYAVKILGKDDVIDKLTGQVMVSQPSRTITIEGNVAFDTPHGIIVGNADQLTLTVRDNSFLGINWNFLVFYGPALKEFIFQGNVTRAGEYGLVSDDNQSFGEKSLVAAAASWSFVGNVIEHHAARKLSYPAGNTLLAPGTLDALLDPVTGRMLDGSAGY